MKISPIASGGVPGVDLGAVSTERTSPDRIEAAKAVARGETPNRETPVDRQAERAMDSIKKIKMRTNRTVNRFEGQQSEALPVEQLAPQVQESAISAESEQAQGSEVTKPLSPQFAALAKQKRALQLERAKLEQEKAELAKGGTDAPQAVLSRLKADPLSVLSEAGVTYDDLAKAITNGPSVNPEVQALKAEVEALKTGIDTKLSERDQLAERQALAEMRREADKLVQGSDAYEMIKATNSTPKVTELIHRVYKQSGEVMDVSEALELVENDLLEQNLKLASIPKIRNRLAPQEQTQQLQQRPQQRQMTTLTNRDAASPLLDRRSRALAAFWGKQS